MTGYRVRNVLLVLLVVILLVSAVLIDNLTSPWKERVKIAQLLLLLGLMAYAAASIFRLRRASGAVLLDLPHPWPGIRLLQAIVAFVGIGTGVFCFVSLLLYPMGLEAALARALTGVLLVSVALLLIAAALGRLRFTERGVFGPSGYIAWEDVAAYRWEGEDGRTLRLIPGRWLPFFGGLPWPVPAEQKGAVEDVLTRHVTAANLATP
jgi:hypothetical protein